MCKICDKYKYKKPKVGEGFVEVDLKGFLGKRFKRQDEIYVVKHGSSKQKYVLVAESYGGHYSSYTKSFYNYSDDILKLLYYHKDRYHCFTFECVG